jgi:chromosomal replication initiation ATPase DnaA
MKERDEDIDLEIKALQQRKSKLLKLARIRREVCELEKNEKFAGEYVVTVKKVATEVCQRFNLTFDRLTRRCRENAVVVPRQVVFYIARELSDIRLVDLSRVFHKDHSTVLYGHRSVKDRMTVDREFAEIVEQLMHTCRQRLVSEISAAN